MCFQSKFIARQRLENMMTHILYLTSPVRRWVTRRDGGGGLMLLYINSGQICPFILISSVANKVTSKKQVIPELKWGLTGLGCYTSLTWPAAHRVRPTAVGQAHHCRSASGWLTDCGSEQISPWWGSELIRHGSPLLQLSPTGGAGEHPPISNVVSAFSWRSVGTSCLAMHCPLTFPGQPIAFHGPVIQLTAEQNIFSFTMPMFLSRMCYLVFCHSTNN